MIKALKINWYALVLLVLAMLIYLSINFYWQLNCVEGGCSRESKHMFISALFDFAKYLAIVIIPFLFLPRHYFTGWLLWCCSWTTVLMLWAMSTVRYPSSGIPSFSRSDFADIWFKLIVLVTIIFIVVRFWLDRRNNTKSVGS